MKLSDIVSVTGLPGLYKTTGKRTDGLIVTSLTDGTTKFVSGRIHLFSTLDNITIYTDEGSRELRQVFSDMKAKEEAHNPAAAKTDDAIKAYFEMVIPDYDRSKFYMSHMKKLLGWFNLLNQKGLIAELIEVPVTQETEAENNQTAEADSETSETRKAAKHEVADKTPKVKKESKPRVEKTVKAHTKAAGGGARKTVTPRKAS